MIRPLALLAFLLPSLAFGQTCPGTPSACPNATLSTLTLGTPLALVNGGLGLTSGTSGGVLGFTSNGVVASSGALTLNALVLGGGVGSTPTVLSSLGSATTVLHGNSTGAPSFAAVNLATDISGILPVANGGTHLSTGASGGILGYTASGTLASSAALAANGLVIGGGAGATPTAITACTNGQIPVGATSAAPACQTIGGDVSAVTSGGAVTVSKLGGISISLGGTTSIGATTTTVGAGTYYAGHSLIGVQVFSTPGTATYTPDAGTNQVIIEVQAPGGGSGGCASTSSSQSCVSQSGGAGAYGKALCTSSFSGITMTVGAVGAAGTAGNNAGGAGGTTSAGSLISAVGGNGGPGGAANAATTFTIVANSVAATAAPTISGCTTLEAVGGIGSGIGYVVGFGQGNQVVGQAGDSVLGRGAASQNTLSLTTTGFAGTGYGWGAGGSSQSASQASGTVGLAGG